MSIDWDGELELDDGTPVKRNGSSYTVTLSKSPYRSTWTGRRDRYWDIPNQAWSYNPDTGVFGGGTKQAMYVVQNVARPEMFIPEDWS